MSSPALYLGCQLRFPNMAALRPSPQATLPHEQTDLKSFASPQGGVHHIHPAQRAQADLNGYARFGKVKHMLLGIKDGS